MQNFTPLNLNKFKAAEQQQAYHSVAPSQAIVKRPSYVPQLIFAAALILTVGTTTYFFQQNKLSQRLLSQATLDNTRPLVELIGKLVVLPQNEEPTIATVTDQSQLPDQFLFKSAENGDKILVYTNAKKAILYRPSLNKIVEMGPVASSDEASNEEVSGVSTPSANIKTTITPTRTPRVIFNPISPTPTEILLNNPPSPTPLP